MALKKARKQRDFHKIKDSADEGFRSLISRMEQSPAEVVHMVLQELHADTGLDRLQAWMLSGPNVYSQLVPFLRETLSVDLENYTAENIRQLSKVSWLKHVKKLYLIDGRQSIPCPPRGQYFALLDFLSKLYNLRSALMDFPKHYEEAVTSILDVLSALPRLKELYVLGSRPWREDDSDDDGDLDDYTVAHHVEQEEEDNSFSSLQTLQTVGVNATVLCWICNRFDPPAPAQCRGGTLVSFRMEEDCILSETLWTSSHLKRTVSRNSASTVRGIKMKGHGTIARP